MDDDFRRRFWEQVAIQGPEDCWLWGGAQGPDGRGNVYLPRRLGREKTLAAHRVVWELETGSSPEEALVLHTCQNPLCMNPDHLYLGTRSDALTQEARSRGGGRTHLSAEEVRKIRRMWEGPHHGFRRPTQGQLAEMFGTSRRSISAIINRRSHKKR